MNREELDDIVETYDGLIYRIRKLIDKLITLDRGYYTYKGHEGRIDEIELGSRKDQTISVSFSVYMCSCCGNEYFGVDIPKDWLFLDDAKLTVAVLAAKTAREEEDRIEAEERNQRAEESRNKQDLETFERLKAKFEK